MWSRRVQDWRLRDRREGRWDSSRLRAGNTQRGEMYNKQYVIYNIILVEWKQTKLKLYTGTLT